MNREGKKKNYVNWKIKEFIVILNKNEINDFMFCVFCSVDN